MLFIVGGLLLSCSFPPLPTSFVAFIAFVPILLAFESGKKYNYTGLYISFFLYHLGSNWWISSFQKDMDIFLMIAGFALDIFHPFFFMFPFALYNWIKSRYSIFGNTSFIFPFIWVFYEWLHGLSDFSYPWLTIGNTQLENLYWIQIIDIGGIWLASLLIMFVNVLFYTIVVKLLNKSNNNYSLKQVRKELIMITMLIMIPIVYSTYIIDKYEENGYWNNKKEISVALIQPNINPWRKWENSVNNQIDLHSHLMDSLNKVHSDIDLYIWSETAVQYWSYDFNVLNNFSYMQSKVKELNSSILFGFSDYDIIESSAKSVTSKEWPLDTSKYYDAYNAAAIVNRDGNNFVYHKTKLTPFAERIPHVDIFSFAGNWIEWGVGVSAWGKGKGQEIIKYINQDDTIKIACIVCIESIYPDFNRVYPDLGAELFVIITNDAWYDYTPGPRQHYLIGAARAIENRRYIARTANTGISGIISPTGRSIDEIEQYTQAGMVGKVFTNDEITIYARYGDYVPITSMLLIFGLIGISFFTKRGETT